MSKGASHAPKITSAHAMRSNRRTQCAAKQKKMSQETPLWEVFIRSKNGLEHRHCGSLHAEDSEMAMNNARDVYTRRNEGVSIWVVASNNITASNPEASGELFEPATDKVYRHTTFYKLPDELKHM